jgi:hypothetical protein
MYHNSFIINLTGLNMDKVEIIALSAAFAIVAVRLYQKYFRKNKGKTGNDTKPSPGAMFSSSSKDDDYEPYSQK